MRRLLLIALCILLSTSLVAAASCPTQNKYWTQDGTTLQEQDPSVDGCGTSIECLYSNAHAVPFGTRSDSTYQWICSEDDSLKMNVGIWFECNAAFDGDVMKGYKCVNGKWSCGGHGEPPCQYSGCGTYQGSPLQECGDDGLCWNCCGDGSTNGICGEQNSGAPCEADSTATYYDADCTGEELCTYEEKYWITGDSNQEACCNGENDCVGPHDNTCHVDGEYLAFGQEREFYVCSDNSLSLCGPDLVGTTIEGYCCAGLKSSIYDWTTTPLAESEYDDGCTNLKDDDCDGLKDAQDSDCQTSPCSTNGCNIVESTQCDGSSTVKTCTLDSTNDCLAWVSSNCPANTACSVQGGGDTPGCYATADCSCTGKSCGDLDSCGTSYCDVENCGSGYDCVAYSSGYHCVAESTGCTSHAQCNGATNYCDISTGTCVACLSNNQCPTGKVCTNNQCVDDQSCTDECTEGDQKCAGILQQEGKIKQILPLGPGYLTCEDHDNDGCTEWGNRVSCPEGSTCEDGECTTTNTCGDGHADTDYGEECDNGPLTYTITLPLRKVEVTMTMIRAGIYRGTFEALPWIVSNSVTGLAFAANPETKINTINPSTQLVTLVVRVNLPTKKSHIWLQSDPTQKIAIDLSGSGQELTGEATVNGKDIKVSFLAPDLDGAEDCEDLNYESGILSCLDTCLYDLSNCTGSIVECNDHQDNDNNGLQDFPADLGCAMPKDTDESATSDYDTDGCPNKDDLFPSIYGLDSDKDGVSDDCLGSTSEEEERCVATSGTWNTCGSCEGPVTCDDPFPATCYSKKKCTAQCECPAHKPYWDELLGCTDTCPLSPSCGDGNIQSVEECDDAILLVGSGSSTSDYRPYRQNKNTYVATIAPIGPRERAFLIDLKEMTIATPPKSPTGPQAFVQITLKNGNYVNSTPSTWGALNFTPPTFEESCTKGYYQCANCILGDDNCEATGTQCGDGNVTSGEQCDGNSWIDNINCTNFDSFLDGTLTCDPVACLFDTSSCLAPEESCGDEILQAGEQCDGNWSRLNCTDFDSFTGGTLACDATTCQYNVSICTGGTAGTCGDGNVSIGEQCDGTNFSGLDCAAFGFMTGSLACDACTINTSGCIPAPPSCGDGAIQVGEQCDNTSWGRIKNCTDFGYLGGDLSCDQETCLFDTNLCVNTLPDDCGNGVIDPGEQCDGSNLNGHSCAEYGYDLGKPTCRADCTVYKGPCKNHNTGGGGGSSGGGGGGSWYASNDDDDEEDAPAELECDVDGDGYYRNVLACIGEGTGADCNDRDRSVNPGASETCNNKDDNCDGNIDEGACEEVIEGELFIYAPSEISIKPFDTKDFTVNFENTGSKSATISLDLDAPTGWESTFQKELTIPGSSSESVKFTVTSDLEPASELQLRASGELSEETTIGVDFRAPFLIAKAGAPEGSSIPIRLIVTNPGSSPMRDLQIETDINEGTHTLYTRVLGTFSVGAGETYTHTYYFPRANIYKSGAQIHSVLKQQGKWKAESNEPVMG